jgi:crossover junction endodeoxyribonuclease RuvC
MRASVLALDLASTMGFCEGMPGERPVSGSVRLGSPGASQGEIYDQFAQFLLPKLRAFRFGLIVAEAPVSPRYSKTNQKTTEMLLGLHAWQRGICHMTGHYNMKTESAQRVRKFLLGKMPAKGQAKVEVMAKVRALGFDPADDNEADAIALWLFTCNEVAPGQAMKIDPLFGRSGG